MPHEAKEQPYCRMCGKPIRKRVRTVWVEPANADRTYHRTGDFSRHAYADNVRTKADCQRLTNMQVVSISRDMNPEFIRRFGEWDGVSYVDPFFCNGNCATRFAYMMAHSYPNIVHRSYNEAAARRKAKKGEE